MLFSGELRPERRRSAQHAPRLSRYGREPTRQDAGCSPGEIHRDWKLLCAAEAKRYILVCCAFRPYVTTDIESRMGWSNIAASRNLVEAAGRDCTISLISTSPGAIPLPVTRNTTEWNSLGVPGSNHILDLHGLYGPAIGTSTYLAITTRYRNDGEKYLGQHPKVPRKLDLFARQMPAEPFGVAALLHSRPEICIGSQKQYARERSSKKRGLGVSEARGFLACTYAVFELEPAGAASW